MSTRCWPLPQPPRTASSSHVFAGADRGETAWQRRLHYLPRFLLGPEARLGCRLEARPHPRERVFVLGRPEHAVADLWMTTVRSMCRRAGRRGAQRGAVDCCVGHAVEQVVQRRSPRRPGAGCRAVRRCAAACGRMRIRSGQALSQPGCAQHAARCRSTSRGRARSSRRPRASAIRRLRSRSVASRRLSGAWGSGHGRAGRSSTAIGRRRPRLSERSPGRGPAPSRAAHQRVGQHLVAALMSHSRNERCSNR